MAFRSDTVLPEPDLISVDALELLNNGGAYLLVRRGDLAMAARTELLDTDWGAAVVFRSGVGGGDGAFWRLFLSVPNANRGSFMTTPGWPVGNDYAAFPPAALLPLEWRLRMLVQRATPIAANAPLFVGICGTPFLNPANTLFPLYGLHSISSENGGAWTVYRRPRHAAGIVTTNTGIQPGEQEIELRYRDTTAPEISLWINGALVDVVTGLANIPQQRPSDGDWGVGALNGLTAGGAGGQTDAVRNVRLTITELPGYPT